MTPTELEHAAIQLHDHLWSNLAIDYISDEWPLKLGGDEPEMTELIRLLNHLQREIKASGYATIDYTRP